MPVFNPGSRICAELCQVEPDDEAPRTNAVALKQSVHEALRPIRRRSGRACALSHPAPGVAPAMWQLRTNSGRVHTRPAHVAPIGGEHDGCYAILLRTSTRLPRSCSWKCRGWEIVVFPTYA